MKYLVSEKCRVNGKTAGNKAREDVEYILKKKGYKQIVLYNSGDKKLIVILKLILCGTKLMLVSKENDIVVFEHPYIPAEYSSALAFLSKLVSKLKKVKTVLIIHDLNSIRLGNLTISKEIKQINSYDAVICHNDLMKSFLQQNGCTKKLINLWLFDYIVKGEKETIQKADYDIVIAGNLSIEKSGYIYSLKKVSSLKFALYGIGVMEEKLGGSISYMGSFSPDILPLKIEGRWGLVWDGDSIDSCIGDNGEYLKINNPHKLSLYLSSGIPVIVWNKSAIAFIVNHYQLGISVSSIKEAEHIIKHISEEKYQEICDNIQIFKERIVSGYYLTKAFDSI